MVPGQHSGWSAVSETSCYWGAMTDRTAGNWPNNGEIDIIEGVNDQTTNDMTLHTSDGCSFSNSGSMTGYQASTNCYAYANGNQGCGVGTGNTQTYGTGFNNIGG